MPITRQCPVRMPAPLGAAEPPSPRRPAFLPDLVAPGPCTGWHAQHALAAALPQCLAGEQQRLLVPTGSARPSTRSRRWVTTPRSSITDSPHRPGDGIGVPADQARGEFDPPAPPCPSAIYPNASDGEAAAGRLHAVVTTCPLTCVVQSHRFRWTLESLNTRGSR